MKDAVRRAYDALHDAGVLHGDVRQPNLLYAGDNRALIVDFEHARFRGGDAESLIDDSGLPVDDEDERRVLSSSQWSTWVEAETACVEALLRGDDA